MAVESFTTRHSYHPGSAHAAESLAGIIFLDPSHLEVWHEDAATGATTELTLTVDYTIGGDGTAGTGTIAALGSYPADDLLHVYRRTPGEQKLRLTPHQPLPSASLERELDRGALRDQERAADADRALRAPAFEPSLNPLPGMPLRSGRVLTFDEAGQPVAGPAVTAIGTVLEFAAAIGQVSDNIDAVNETVENLVPINVVADDLSGPDTIGAVAAVAEEVVATAGVAPDIAEFNMTFAAMRVVAFEQAGYSHAVIDEANHVLALINKSTGKWIMALDEASLIDLPGGLTFEAVEPHSGWLLPILDAEGNVLGGWLKSGEFRVAFDRFCTFPDGFAAAAVTSALIGGRQGIPTERLFFSGDSLTAGAGGSGTSYPAVMADALGLDFHNSAVGGTRSGSIGVRQGGIPMLLTLADDLPADTSEVDVSVYSEEIVNNQGSSIWTGTLAGIPVQLKRYGDTDPATTLKYTVKRLSAGTVIAIPPATAFLNDLAAENELDFHYIQAGRNDAKTTHADRVAIRDNILSMIDRVGHDRFAILPVKNGGAAEGVGTSAYDQIMETNRLIAEAVGWHFCDTRSYLASYAALEDAELTPTSQDDADIAADGIPASLRFDGIHGNAAYYEIEGAFVARWHRGHAFRLG